MPETKPKPKRKPCLTCDHIHTHAPTSDPDQTQRMHTQKQEAYTCDLSKHIRAKKQPTRPERLSPGTCFNRVFQFKASRKYGASRRNTSSTTMPKAQRVLLSWSNPPTAPGSALSHRLLAVYARPSVPLHSQRQPPLPNVSPNVSRRLSPATATTATLLNSSSRSERP